MDGSIMPLGITALVAAMLITMYDMASSLKPVTCAECPHCQAIADADRREQERLSREYARRVGLDDRDDDDRTLS